MKIKRFFAKNMRLALRKVREEQGPDAVILSNRKVDDGIEVVAAVDYDESLMARAVAETQNVTATADEAAPQTAAEPAPFEAFLQVAEAVQLPTPPPQAPELDLASDPTVSALRQELAGMRTLLEEQVSSLAWSKEVQRDPQRTRVLRRLSALGVDADVARYVAQRVLEAGPPDQACTRILPVLSQCLPVSAGDAQDVRGVVAVVGPTGVGKTTTIAKIAARFALHHGREHLALVSTDSFRIGAQEQLATFAQILDVPVHLAHGAKELADVLSSLSKKRLVLIDTAGTSQRDAALADNLAMFDIPDVDIRLLLALPANGQRQALDEVARRFAARTLSGCILTKLDEAASLGAAFSTVIRHRLPLAFLTDGQRVPEDLHTAPDKQQWMVNYAARLLKASGAKVDEATIARNFAEVHTHAYA